MRPGITYKNFLICATPVAVCALGAYMYFDKPVDLGGEDTARNSGKDEPKTPLEEAIALKDKGNKYFKGGKYESAIDCYSKAIEKCPESASTELATFYQNRAAAKENLTMIESAIEDCSTALNYSPRYLKALNRRGKLYERTSQPYLCLLDVTATTIFEEFSNMDSVMALERVLTQLAANQTETRKGSIKHDIPTRSFIRNYFSAFDWDPLLCQDNDQIIKSWPIFSEEETIRLPFEELHFCMESMQEETNQLSEFLRALFKALTACRNGDYENSLKTVEKALDQMQPAENLFKLQTPAISSGKIKIFIALAKLLEGTFYALSGKTSEAHQLLDDVIKTHQEGSVSGIQSIINGATDQGDQKVDWFKHPMLILIKVNALIKKACLIMTSEHDVASCLSAFQQAEQICPQCPDLYLHRGQIFILTDQYDEALNNLSKAIKLQPNNSVARCQRIFASYRKAVSENDFERACTRVEDFKKLLTKYPNCIETRSLYAQILSERLNFGNADEEFEEVLRISPDSGIFYGHRAMMHLRWKQDRESAKKILQQGLEMDEKCGMLHELLAQLSIETGEFDEAMHHMERAIDLSTSEAELRHLIALQMGASAQKEVCQIYGISKKEINQWHLVCQQKMMDALQSR